MNASKRIYPSGSQKRKKKAQVDADCKKLKKITSFLDFIIEMRMQK